MGLSETIVAAMIGACATITTALFQIFSSLKNRGRIDPKPKRGSATRSVFAVLALMIASAVGGFLYSELLRQRDSEDLRAMRAELRELKELTASARNIVALPAPEPLAVDAPVESTPVSHMSGAQRAESLAYVPACRRSSIDGQFPVSCAEADAQRIALCGSIPAYARINTIELFAQPDAVQNPWDEHRTTLEQDLGGARFTGKSFEYAQSAELKAVCVNFLQWSSEHSHIARIVVNYGFGDVPAEPSNAPSMRDMPAVIAAESGPRSDSLLVPPASGT